MADPSASTPPEGFRISSAEVVGVVRAFDRSAFHPPDNGDALLRFNTKYLPPGEDPLLAAERSRRDLATRIDFLLDRGEHETARLFLTSFSFLAARLAFAGTDGVLGDFRAAAARLPPGQSADLRLVQDAFALAEPILRIAPSQLPEQLLARLPTGRGERTDRLCAFAEQSKKAGAWLKPLRATFTGPGQGLRRVLERHRGLPSAVAFSPDGALLVSADPTELFVWDAVTYDIKARLRGHHEEVTAVQFTRDGHGIVASVRAPYLFYWRLDQKGPPLRLTGHTGAVLALAALSDGRILSAATDGALVAWDLARQQAACVGNLPHPVHSLALFPGGDRCLSASGGLLSSHSTLTVWDIVHNQTIQTVAWDHGGIDRVAVAGDGRAVLAAANQVLLRWELPAWTGPREFGRHDSKICGLIAGDDARWAVSCDTGGAVKVWDLQESFAPRLLKGHRLMVSDIALSPAGQLATTGMDRTVRIWEFPPRPDAPAPHGKAVTRVASWSWRRQRFIVSASQDHTLAVFGTDGPAELFRLNGHTHWVSGIAVVPRRGWAVSASWDGSAALWDLTTGRPLRQTPTGDPHLTALAVDPESGRIATASFEGPIRLWDLETGAEICALASCGVGQVSCLAFASDSRGLLAGGRGLTRLEMTAAGVRQSGPVLLEGEQVNAVALFPTTACCLAATASGRLHLCDVQRAQLLTIWQDGPAAIADVALDPRGRWALTAGGMPFSASDDTLRVWDCRTGQVAARLIGDGPFTSCSFTADGTGAVAGDVFGKLHWFALRGLPDG